MVSSFPPLINENSRILLLGTMPGVESLRKQEYYGHPSNHFWRILFTLLDVDTSLLSDYEAKTRILLDNKIALWDVLAFCDREGSADSAIKSEIPNDFNRLHKEYPLIKDIFFTAKKAEDYYAKYVGEKSYFNYYTLPSPSSANARKKLEEKVEDWRIIKRVLDSL